MDQLAKIVVAKIALAAKSIWNTPLI